MIESKSKIKAFMELLIPAEGRMSGSAKGYFFVILPICWAFFQLWITSPLPYYFRFGVFNNTETRAIHLAFGILLAFTAYPRKRGTKNPNIPAYDWLLAIVAALCAMYLVIFKEQIAMRPGIPTQLDIIVACAGVLLLLEATRRVMGLPMTVAATIFLIYSFFGPYMPDMIAHRGASISRAASHFWLTQEGVFGVPLGVSAEIVFLYVLFGAMLERSGAGNYLTTLSFSLLGRFSGGPAKAAVLASGLHGLISGSSIANVLTCGPITIMLMKRVGFSAERAGAIEVSAATNSQILPPIMGAAAFLMIEYINMPYSQLIKHALIPALLAYASLLYIVHLEAKKMGMQGFKSTAPLRLRLINIGLTVSGIIIIFAVLSYVLKFIPIIFGGYSWIAFIILLVVSYISLLLLSTRYPQYEGDFTELPKALPTFLSGLHFIIPIVVLVWCLMVKQMSAGLAAFYACLVMSVILLTQNAILAFVRKESLSSAFLLGTVNLLKSFIGGSRNMIMIALATSCAGIIVGAISLTGVGQVLAGVVETISMGYMPLILLFTAVFAIIIGIGLPTTANYIIVSTLLAPVIYNLAAANGLEIPLVAIHLFCLYFGLMADSTPPVALAAFAASGISGGDPIKTGVMAFLYDLRTAILPFVFIYNPELLLINITSIPHLMWVLTSAWFACMAFASATKNFMLVRNRLWETGVLILAMILLFRPDIPRDQMFPGHKTYPTEYVMEEIAKLEPGKNMRLLVQSDTGRDVRQRVIILPIGADSEGKDAEQRLVDAGIFAEMEGSELVIYDIGFNSRAESVGLDIGDDNSILGIDVELKRPPKWIFSAPGLFLFGLVYFVQYRRRQLGASARLN